MNDHFDGISDKDGTLISTYTVERWNDDGVNFTGKSLKFPVTALFRGTLDPLGGRVNIGFVEMKINGNTVFTNAAFKLDWSKSDIPSTTPEVPEPTSVAVARDQPSPASTNVPQNSGSGSAVPQQQMACAPVISPEECAGLWALSKASAERNMEGLEQNALRRQQAKPKADASSSRIHLGFRDLPQPLTKGAAIIPEGLRTAFTKASCTVDVLITKDGLVKSARFKDGPLGFEQAAEDTALHYTFKPYVVEGHQVELSTSLPINFSLEDLPSDPAGFPIGSPTETGKLLGTGLPKFAYLCRDQCNMWILDSGSAYTSMMPDGTVNRVSMIMLGDDKAEFVQQGYPEVHCKGRIATDGNVYGFLTWRTPQNTLASYGGGVCTAELIYPQSAPAKNFLLGRWRPEPAQGVLGSSCDLPSPGACELFMRRQTDMNAEAVKRQTVTFTLDEMITFDIISQTMRHSRVTYHVTSPFSVTVDIPKHVEGNGDADGYSVECRALKTKALFCLTPNAVPPSDWMSGNLKRESATQ